MKIKLPVSGAMSEEANRIMTFGNRYILILYDTTVLRKAKQMESNGSAYSWIIAIP